VFLLLLVASELSVAVVALLYRSTVISDLDNRLLDQLATRYGAAGTARPTATVEEIALNRDFTAAMDYTQYRVKISLPYCLRTMPDTLFFNKRFLIALSYRRLDSTCEANRVLNIVTVSEGRSGSIFEDF